MTTHHIIEPLAEAAQRALRAPSAFNSQPWRWRVGGGVLDLYADRTRQLKVTDPDGRLLTLGCGTALHHARVALAAAGHEVEVARFPDPADPDLFATLRVTGSRAPADRDVALDGAIPDRRTDRRAFGERPVPPEALSRLRAAVEAEGAFLHVVRPDQMPMLAVATADAAAIETADPAYRYEVHHWTNRPSWTGDGVPNGVAVRQVPRRVMLRDHALDGEPGLEPGSGNDRGAAYAILFGRDDTPSSWLSAGEALSALLLTAVLEGLAAAPISDTIELAWPRRLMRDLLAGVGEPYLVIRLGVPAESAELPPVPRRAPDDVIELA
ncbi:Acg family FMN-binding oxidoreductase [Phytohabitans suffuscus]|uniref:NAD(P)H nitroreductase n=1 Tax=Phytohabitans suffuscus TaxID=624315 RepID=A0A6F8YUX1_9ACTN|nr:nitroreductase [Phytohabitans suffuscus]BCB89783.1 NAD(P)H nitroreductase [Phytohabitans suffuscus]